MGVKVKTYTEILPIIREIEDDCSSIKTFVFSNSLKNAYNQTSGYDKEIHEKIEKTIEHIQTSLNTLRYEMDFIEKPLGV